MADCKWCGNTGWFLTVTKDGLCRKCESEVKMHVLHLTQQVKESVALMDKANEVETRLGRGQKVVKHLRELVPYHAKGLVAMRPTPQEWVARIYVKERQIVRTHLEKNYTAAVKQLQRHARIPSSTNDPIRQMAALVEKFKPYLSKVQLREWSSKVDQMKGLSKVEEAAKSKEYGNKQRALDQYMEALDMLRADDNGDPSDEARINDIKERIRELGGDVPEAG